MKKINELPQEIQEEVKEILREYADVAVWFEGGRYKYELLIETAHAPEREYIGRYYPKDVYTEEERIVNYCEQFHSYPIEYKGERDYELIKDWHAKYKMINGNIVRA